MKLTRNMYIHAHAALRLRIEACEENEDYKGARPFRAALKWLDEQWNNQQVWNKQWSTKGRVKK